MIKKLLIYFLSIIFLYVFEILIYYFLYVFEILFLQAIVSWLAARQFTLLCGLLEQFLLLLRGEYPLIRGRMRASARLVFRILALLWRRMCLLIILRKHAGSIGAPNILRGHGSVKREL